MYRKEKIEKRWIKIEDLSIHYLTAGETGSPVILLHGGIWDSASLSWKLTIGFISQNHKVFALDLPGCGESDRPNTECTNEYYVNFLGQFMNALGLKKTSLVGFSMGGAIALGFSLQSPEKVDKLVLVDSYGLDKEIILRRILYLLARIPVISRLIWSSSGWSRWMAKFNLCHLSCNSKNVTKELVEDVYHAAKERKVEAFQSWLRSELGWNQLRTNFLDKLHEVTIPTLILHGAEDKVIPVSSAKKAHSKIKDSKLHIFSECGHWPPREKTNKFNEILSSFL